MNMYEEFVEISKKLRQLEGMIRDWDSELMLREKRMNDLLNNTFSRIDEIEKKLEKNEKPPQVVMQAGNNTTLSQEVKPNVMASSKVFW